MKNKIFAFTILALMSALVLAGGLSRPAQTISGPTSQTAYVPSGWTTPVNISNSAAESRNPVIAVDAQGRAYVTWIDWPDNVGAGGARDMMFNSNRTGQWQPYPSVVGSVNYTAIDDVGFPTVAVTRSGSNFAIAYHDADYSRGLMQSWYREWANGAWGPLSVFSEAPASCSYIMLAYSPLDNSLFGIFMADDNDVFNFGMRYRDGVSGPFFGPQWINVLMGSSKYNYLTKTIAIDPSGTAHIVFTTHNQGWYSKNPNPKNFDGWTSSNLTGGTGLSDIDPRIVVDNDGEAYVVWQQNIGGNPDIMLRKTVNNGQQWLDPENVSNTSTKSDFPTIAVNPATKEIYIAWQEEVASGNWQVMLKSYELQPGGATKSWSSAVNMSSDFGVSGEPFLAWDANGTLHLVYAAAIGGNRLDIVYTAKPGVSISITSPNGGESWQALKSYPVTWTTTGTVANVKIEYSTNGGSTYTTVVASTPNSGSYAWTVANAPSTNCLVRVSEATSGSPVDTSDAVFTITTPPLTLTSPNGGESWEAYKTYPITWTTAPPTTVANVKIESSTDGGSTYTTVVASAPNTGSYSWIIPNTPSTNCLVRISEASTDNYRDASNAVFTILRPSIQPPLNLAIDTALNSARDRKTNSLAWAANPENVNVTVASHKIYRKPAGAADSVFAVMASVAGTATQYADPDLDIITKYAYRVTAVSSLGAESIPTATVVETKKFEFAPVGVSITTVINKLLFNQIKDNTVLFSSSPYNPSVDIAGYDVYRRKASESDSALVFIKSLDAATFSYKDAGLKGGGKYAYALKTRYADGRISDLSAVAAEK